MIKVTNKSNIDTAKIMTMMAGRECQYIATKPQNRCTLIRLIFMQWISINL